MGPTRHVEIPVHLQKPVGTPGGRLLEIERSKASFSVETLQQYLHGNKRLERLQRLLPILENEVSDRLRLGLGSQSNRCRLLALIALPLPSQLIPCMLMSLLLTVRIKKSLRSTRAQSTTWAEMPSTVTVSPRRSDSFSSCRRYVHSLQLLRTFLSGPYPKPFDTCTHSLIGHLRTTLSPRSLSVSIDVSGYF